jgi:GntR family transcriptional regulator/MocR family aminotransferase
MLDEGYLTRLVRAARRQYARRSQSVQQALGAYGELSGGAAGMYVTLSLEASTAEHVARMARADGVEVPLLADYCRTAARAGLVVGYGGVSDDDFERALRTLARTLRRATAAI